ncbi:MAG: dTMP kinase [Spirochaetales bacterium]|nr:dTMP kinase [Spirochaetales bacterium]
MKDNKTREIWSELVVIEGIDGAGTTTLSRLLSQELTNANIPHQNSCEPTDSPIGRVIRSALAGTYPIQNETMALLFAADRREHLWGKGGLQDQIHQGNIAITDRYFFSSLAYQGLDKDEELVLNLNAPYPLPGYLIFLGINADEAMARIAHREGKDIYETVDFQDRVAAAYRHAIEAHRHQGMAVLELDSRRPPEELRDEALAFLAPLIQQKSHH